MSERKQFGRDNGCERQSIFKLNIAEEDSPRLSEEGSYGETSERSSDSGDSNDQESYSDYSYSPGLSTIPEESEEEDLWASITADELEIEGGNDGTSVADITEACKELAALSFIEPLELPDSQASPSDPVIRGIHEVPVKQKGDGKEEDNATVVSSGRVEGGSYLRLCGRRRVIRSMCVNRRPQLHGISYKEMVLPGNPMQRPSPGAPRPE